MEREQGPGMGVDLAGSNRPKNKRTAAALRVSVDEARRKRAQRLTPRVSGAVINLPFHNNDQERLYLAEVRAYIVKYNLHPDVDAAAVQITGTLNGSRRGDREKEMKTIKEEYAPKWNEFSRFAWYIGDVRSAVITCDKLRPTRGQPADPETMHCFMMYKSEFGVDTSGKPNKICTKTTGEAICWERGDLQGQNVICVGTWHAACSPRKFRVAMKLCHRIYENCKNEYQKACDRCLEASLVDGPIDHAKPVIGRQYRSCIECQAPRIVPTGDPTTSLLFQNTYKRIEKKCLTDHDPQGCLSLSVRRVRALRQYLLSDGADQFKRLQLWTIFLLGVKCFLRCEEAAGIGVDDFAIHAFEVDKREKRVEHLALFVRGKADTEYVLLSLWRDDDNPEFCPVRALLVYLAAANLKSGVLFPTWDTAFERHALTAGGQPGQFKTPVTYAYIRTNLKSALEKCFAGDTQFLSSGRVGTHTMRKTAYLFAVFAVLSKYDAVGRNRHTSEGTPRIQALEMDDIEKAARHGSHSNSALYFGSHSNLYEKVGPKTKHWAYHKVSPWRSCYCGKSKSKERYDGNEDWSTRTSMSLPQLADWFVSEELQVSVDLWDPVKALEIACRIPKRSDETFGTFISFLKEHLTPANFDEGKALFDRCCLEIQREHDDRNAESLQQQHQQQQNTTISPTTAAKDPKISYEKELNNLMELKSRTGVGKKAVYDEMARIANLPRRNLTAKTREKLKKISQSVRCVEWCVQHCYKGVWEDWEKQLRGTIPLGGYGKWICKTCNLTEIKKQTKTAAAAS